MSLQVWLPLNGSIDNQGICDTVVASSTNPQYTTGKLGQGINLNQRVNFIGLPKMNNFSIFFWAKVDSCTSDWADLLGFTCNKSDDTTAPEFRFEGTKSTRACFWHNNGTTGYGISSGTQILIQNYREWHHVGVVYDGNNIYSYIDGELTYTNEGLGGYIINNFHIGQTGAIVGVINDLRVYDTALSKLEVKEISKGLICHLPMSHCGMGNFNMLDGTATWGNWSSSTTIPTIDEDTGVCSISSSSQYPYYQLINIDIGETYTISVDAKADENFTATNGILLFAYFNSSNERVSYKWGAGNLSTEWEHKKWTIQIPDNTEIKRLSVGLRATNDKAIYLRKLKVEKGNSDTGWNCSVNDMKVNEFVECDTSGFGYDGTLSQSLLYSADSAVGQYSLDLTGGDFKSYVRVANYPQLEKDFTWNVWVKQIDSVTPKYLQAIISQGRDWNGASQGFNLFLSNGIPEIRYGYWEETKNGNVNLSSGITLDSNWHMITASINKEGIGKIYVDGELKKTASTATTCDYTQADGNLVIGKLSHLYSSSNQYYAFNGLIDDVKLFASTLSDEDIKKLYEVKSNINKTGQIMCSNFVETNITGNFFTDDQFPTGVTGNAGTVMKGELVDCKYANTGKATKLTCTTAGNGFYISGRGAFGSTSVLEDGKQYVWSMYIKSDNRTSIRFNVEYSSKQSKTSFTIGKEYKKIYSVYTYQSGKQYTAFTCYPSFNLNDNIYIHSFKVEEYNPDALLDKKGNLKNNCFIENEDIEKCYIYKQDIQTNQIIEI